MGRVCVGRLCYGPSLQWAEFVMGRDVQLPEIFVGAVLYFTLVRCGAVQGFSNGRYSRGT